MIPTIEFRYSWIYDELFKKGKKNSEYPSLIEIKKFIKELEKDFKINQIKILKEISKISKLKWKEKKIIVYVVGRCIPFSDPLTISLIHDKKRTIKILIHELIHQIQIQGSKNWENWWSFLKKAYPKENIKTKSHIFLNAVNWMVLNNLFGKKVVDLEIDYYKRLPDYKRAWEIVKEETPEKIIHKFNQIENKIKLK